MHPSAHRGGLPAVRPDVGPIRPENEHGEPRQVPPDTQAPLRGSQSKGSPLPERSRVPCLRHDALSQ